jgi:hypothetical protein
LRPQGTCWPQDADGANLKPSAFAAAGARVSHQVSGSLAAD